LWRHIDLLFGERLDMLLTTSDKKISGFTRPHVIGFVADLFFSNLAPSTLKSKFPQNSNIVRHDLKNHTRPTFAYV